MSLPERSMTVLVAALGGEGGGVLADWIIAAATAHDYPVQSTSIPGVAQRTGATTYYVELYPAKWSELGGKRPVMALTPSPGNVDLMVASELIEAGRAMQNGFVSPERTTLVFSTHRIYTTAEKMQMGDGRIEGDKVLKAANELAKRAVMFDMAELATQNGTVISAVLFGALAGAGALPLSRKACEDAIRASGKGVEASLKGFDAAYRHATGELQPAQPEDVKRWRANPVERVRQAFPAETHRLLEEGANRCMDYQDAAYASLYLDRLEPVMKLDRDQGGAATGYKLTNELGRFLALWMCYEDVIRVADLKSRKSRFERVRKEVMAKPDEPVHVTEYLKPGVEEVAAILPPGLGHKLEAWGKKKGSGFNRGMYVTTTSVYGFLMLRALAVLRPWRRRSMRYAIEQATIERWIDAVKTAAPRDLGLALEIALCGRLIKGYGDTYKRGRENFLRIMDTIVGGEAKLASDTERKAAIRAAREAALADPEGRKLEQSLATVGITPLPPKAKPITFIRKSLGNKSSGKAADKEQQAA
jgi:indolepyruvate ferredoxin oxidoreductase, beta subunit